VRREAVHVYLDVSGSMDAALPALYATLASLSGLLHPQVHLFSTRIDDIDLRQLARGVRVTTGGTDITPVTQHALKHQVRRALFVTDGWVGKVPDEHSRELGRRKARFAAVVTQDGEINFAAALGAKAWRLPNLEHRA
jgi:predicted metal-dependent peptidase